MSVYSVAASDKGIFNLPKEVEAIDVSTRNAYNATIIGYEAGPVNQGNLNAFFGYRAGQTTKFGSCNTFLGAQAGEKNVNGANNLIAGTLAARFLTTGSRNVVLGNNSGTYLNGNNNVFIGFNNTIANVLPLSSCNISVGTGGNVFGYNNISFGNNSFIFANKGISLGEAINDTTENSILIGGNIVNRGSNVLIINNRHNSNAIAVSFSNIQNDYMNINDYIIASKNAQNKSVLKLTNDVIEMASSNLVMNLFDGNVVFGEVMQLSGKYSSLELNQSITLGLNSNTNPNATRLTISSNVVTLGGRDVNNMTLQGSNVSFKMNSNVITLSNQFAEIDISSNILRMGGSNVDRYQIYASNVSFYLNSNVVSLSNNFAEVAIKSNNTFIGGSNLQNLRLYTSNAYLTFNSNVLGFSNNYLQVAFDSNNLILGGSRVTDILSYGYHISFGLNSNVINLSNDFGQFAINSNNFSVGGANINNTRIYGSNVSFALNSNIIALSNTYVETYLDERTIRIGGSNNKVTSIYGSNNSMTMSNGGVFLQSDLIVYRNTILSNNLIVNKIATFKDNVYLHDDVTAYSNATFEQDLYINSNSVVYLNNNVSFCNDNRFFIRGSGETQVLQPLMTKCNVFVENKMSFCNMQVRYVNWDNVQEKELQELYGSTIVQRNLFVGGMMYTPGLNVSDRLVMQSGNGINQWSQFVAISSNANPYLVFQSGTGTTIKLGDDFTPELFNFTGKHRCSPCASWNTTESIVHSMVGRIVVATGDYNNLDDENKISIDEAVPVVKMCNIKHDTRAFGVISGFESYDDKRIYKLGNLQFETKKATNSVKVIVNSVGEGGIWVCDQNGSLKNGDLITCSDVVGFGMKQDDDLVRSHTVAKISCDCVFDNFPSSQDIWQPEIKKFINYDGKKYNIAFVGCTYKF